MAVIGTPPIREPAGEKWSNVWGNWFNQVRLICFAQQESGTTANRPTSDLYPGRRYMDLTLNIPIWYTSGGWRDATGGLV